MPAIGTGVSTAKGGGQSWSSYWEPQSYVVENAAPSSIILTYSKSIGLAPDKSLITVTVNGNGDTVNSVSLSVDKKTLTVVLATAIANGQTVSITINDGTSGHTYSVINNVQIKYGDEKVVQIQPTGAAVQNCTIYSSQPTYNTGAYTLGCWIGETNAAAVTYRTLLKMDLSSIPETAKIVSCKLHFRIKADLTNTARDFKVYRLKRNWAEGTGSFSASGDGATWNTYDGTNGWQTAGGFGANDCEQTAIGIGHVVDASPLNGNPFEFTLNVTSKAELDLGYGWLIKADTESNDCVQFFNSNDATEAQRPALFVSYVEADETPYVFERSEYGMMINGTFGTVWRQADNDYLFYYSNLVNIYRSTSSNGLVWSPIVVGSPVMTPASGVTELCNVWKEGSTWYMLYRSTEWHGTYIEIGLATSSDGLTWTKYAGNPVMTKGGEGQWDNFSIDPYGVMKIGSTYYLWYNTVSQSPRKTGLATSTDLINWTRHASNPIFDNQRYCACPIKYNNKYYLFISYSVDNSFESSPTKHRIELYRCSNPTFLPNEREYLGIIQIGSGKGSFCDYYIDTPSVLTNDINRDSYPMGDELWMYYSGKDNTKWYTGLSVGSLTAIAALPSKAEPAAGT